MMRCRSFVLLLRCWIALLSCLAAPLVQAQPSPIGAASAQLVQIERDLHGVDRALDGKVDDDARAELRDTALAARASATNATATLAEQLALVDARLAEIGATAAPGEAPDIRSERIRLTRQHAILDSAVKRGKLLGVEAQQLIDEIADSQAEQFGQRISARVPSPLAPTFWSAVLHNAPRDLRRVSAFIARGVDTIRVHPRAAWPWPAIFGLSVALLALIPGRAAAQRLGLRFLIDGAPGHRVRRSANAMWRVLVGTLAPLIASSALIQGMRWSQLQPAGWSALFDAFIVATTYAGFTAAVTGALLMRHQPTWRVAPIPDDAAQQLRPFTWLLAAIAFVTILWDSFNAAVGVSAAALSATQAVETVLHLGMLAGALVVVARLRAARADAAELAPSRAGLGATALFAWLIVLAALLALLAGYLGFALFVVQLVAWTAVLGSAVFLLMAAVDDVTATVFTRDSAVGRGLARALGVRGTVVDQFGILASGVMRLVLGLAALGLLFAPFGAGGGVVTLFGRLATLAQGVQIGGIAISPGAILRSLLVLFVGLALVRGFLRWLDGKYLPATDLDGSGRNSVTLVARYVGIALATIWSLASLGIGIERIALLLSALSVGIGFGLQAITSNFVSGLILLAERPIKIGDLVRIGLDEGDVKRISVRSTEIELPDHSTLIVPNSELITKTVHNKTLASPLGRIQIQFSIPIGQDADHACDIVTAAFAEHQAVLDAPAPAVFIDSIADGRILFNCFAHVDNPRAAYRARSELLAHLLRRFREDGIELGTVPQRLEIVPAAPET